jgi:UDP-N-acetylmuramyl pentapeptide phosphotransferase/UDP-N-acetylglucosamine-1-phosphate transferase
MGDTGSLLVGLICSILSIKFIEINKTLDPSIAVQSVPAVAMGVMLIPLFDTIRVFTLRAMKGKSPFSPDKTHLHHLLLEAGCSHTEATTILTLTNLLFIFIVFKLQFIGSLPLIFLLLFVSLTLTFFLQKAANRGKQAPEKSLKNG